MRLRVSGKARGDMLRAHRYLTERNPRVAERFLNEIDLRFSQLSDFPHLGRERFEFGRDLRSTRVMTYLVIYAVRPNYIDIVRVIDGRMDVYSELHK
jgi:plasmid stabilization system protein ParE